jgi:hypothetical protein
MPTIHIQRGPEWADYFRRYVVMLDGREVARLGRDQEITLPVSAGMHTLQLSLDWCKSNAVAFSVGESDSRTFTCGNNPGPLLALLYIVLWPSSYLWLRSPDRLMGKNVSGLPTQTTLKDCWPHSKNL